MQESEEGDSDDFAYLDQELQNMKHTGSSVLSSIISPNSGRKVNNLFPKAQKDRDGQGRVGTDVLRINTG